MSQLIQKEKNLSQSQSSQRNKHIKIRWKKL